MKWNGKFAGLSGPIYGYVFSIVHPSTAILLYFTIVPYFTAVHTLKQLSGMYISGLQLCIFVLSIEIWKYYWKIIHILSLQGIVFYTLNIWFISHTKDMIIIKICQNMS